MRSKREKQENSGCLPRGGEIYLRKVMQLRIWVNIRCNLYTKIDFKRIPLCFVLCGSSLPGRLHTLRDSWKQNSLAMNSCYVNRKCILSSLLPFYLKKNPLQYLSQWHRYFNAGHRHTYPQRVLNTLFPALCLVLETLTTIPVWHLKKSYVLRVA